MAAIDRELCEELQVRLNSLGRTLFQAVDPSRRFLVVFREVTISGTPLAKEHDALAWAGPRGISFLPLAPTDRQFVTKALQLSGAVEADTNQRIPAL